MNTLQNSMFLGKTGTRTLLSIHGFSGVRIEQYSSIKSEAEVLFSPGMVIRECAYVCVFVCMKSDPYVHSHT